MGHGVVGAALAAALGLVLLGRMGRVGVALRRGVAWGAGWIALVTLLAAAGAPAAWRPAVNPITVGSAFVLGAPGVALTLFAHALLP
ncbi:MAG: hypothetical protein K6V73_10855 [Firmicutes bacterium]|nr:hypothetical protein [Bacillota bacterium]